MKAIKSFSPEIQKIIADCRAAQYPNGDQLTQTAPGAIPVVMIFGDVTQVLTSKEVEQVSKLSECHPTNLATCSPDGDGRLRMKAAVATNGLNFLIIEPK